MNSDDEIQTDVWNDYDIIIFTRDLMNFIIPGNPATITTEEDTEFVRRLFDDYMRTAVISLLSMYRTYVDEMFKAMEQRNCVNMEFFNAYASLLRRRLFRRNVNYDKYLHFSVILVYLAANFYRDGFEEALYSTYYIIQSLLMNRVPTYDLEELHRIAQEYTYSYTDSVARGMEILGRLFSDTIDTVNRRSSEMISGGCGCDKRIKTKDEKTELKNNEEIEKNEAVGVVRNSPVRTFADLILPGPRFERQQLSDENNPEIANSSITSPSLDYIAIPGTSRDSDPGVIFRNPDSEEHQLTPSTGLFPRNLNKRRLYESGSPKKAKWNTTSPNNPEMQCKNSGNKNTSRKNIESSSDTE